MHFIELIYWHYFVGIKSTLLFPDIIYNFPTLFSQHTLSIGDFHWLCLFLCTRSVPSTQIYSTPLIMVTWPHYDAVTKWQLSLGKSANKHLKNFFWIVCPTKHVTGLMLVTIRGSFSSFCDWYMTQWTSLSFNSLKSGYTLATMIQ